MSTYKFTNYFIFIFIITLFYSCQKKDEQSSQINPPQELSSDKEKELKDREEFLNLKEQKLKEWEDKLSKQDSTGVLKDNKDLKKDTVSTVKDTSKVKVKTKKEKLEEKEKELNKRLGNPKSTIHDYLEYIQRGISDTKNFDGNMQKASELWESRNAESFKKNYKGVSKFVIENEPETISQKGNTASVKVKVKQTTSKNGKNDEKEVIVTYNLVADKNGNWKIKNNIVK
jgi:hypothetical protein